jgi:type IV fimbrial biogenesis protein FimT
MTRQRACGVSLLEACIVLAIAAVLAAMAVPSFSAALQRRAVQAAASQFEFDVHEARMQALSRSQRVRIRFAADGRCYVVHTGPAGGCTCEGGGPPRCDASAEVLKAESWALDAGVRVLASVPATAFDPVHGTASPAVTVRVAGPDGRAVHEVVNIMGRVHACSPAPAMAGYQPC